MTKKRERVVPTQARVRELLRYDPDTGSLTWRCNRGNKPVAGLPAGRRQGGGYIQITIDHFGYMAHRVAWLYMTGNWPGTDWRRDGIDHIDGDRTNNRWSNLRLATRSQNTANTPVRSYSRSGVKGVQLRCDGGFRARVRLKGAVILDKTFASLDEAAAAYDAHARRTFGEFQRS